MFILTKMSDLVQITPNDFAKKSHLAIQDNINAKYSNKIIQKIGLCLCLYDLISASEGLIGHGDGLVNVNVEFRMLVFRPFLDEVIYAKIVTADPEGMRLRVDFFDDIYVPADELPEDSEFDATSKLWMWNVDDQQMHYDLNEHVRLRIIDEKWKDQTPTDPIDKPGLGGDEAAPPPPKEAPWTVLGSMADPGLGPCLWWD